MRVPSFLQPPSLPEISLPQLSLPGWATSPPKLPERRTENDVPDEASVHLESAAYEAARARELLPNAVPGWIAVESVRSGWTSGDKEDDPRARAMGAALKVVMFGAPASVAGVLCAPTMAALHGCEAGKELFETARAQLFGARRTRARGLLGTSKPLEPVVAWQAKEAFRVDWYPMQERPFDGDRRNLYSTQGACAVWDRAFGTNSRGEQARRHRRAVLSTSSDAFWAGFCNNAAAVACVFDPPLHSVWRNGVEFTPETIKGLLILASNDVTNAPSCSEWIGEANRAPLLLSFLSEAAGLDMFEHAGPAAHRLHEEVFKGWGATRNLPFAFDIEPKSPIYNYPFDGGRVEQLRKSPEGFDPRVVPLGGEVKHYRARITSTGFPERNRMLTYWIHTADDGAKQSGWIHSPGSTEVPNFAWLPARTGEFRGPSSLNSQIDLAVLKEIYDASRA